VGPRRSGHAALRRGMRLRDEEEIIYEPREGLTAARRTVWTFDFGANDAFCVSKGPNYSRQNDLFEWRHHFIAILARSNVVLLCRLVGTTGSRLHVRLARLRHSFSYAFAGLTRCPKLSF
jgi:hypothetical protein